ncbi:MAG: PEP-utilizing enzyme [Defluviitaleaceae bacterium]|nr:PEP-utilizing enzyme [Defluviitaleaceae bacterium]
MYSFDELKTIADRNVADRKSLIGMKAESLLYMRENGFNVPDGFVVTAEELGAVTAEMLAEYADEAACYAVRSSGTSEDLAGASFAGQYESFLNVKGYAGLLTAIKACAGSIHNERVVAYAKRCNIDISESKMAVIVQRMVSSEKSGVAFSINSIDGRDKEILIEAVSGLGDKLVGGHATPDSYAYNWYDDEITIYNGGALTRQEVKTLGEVILDIQVLYGLPVDVEWAIVGESVHILQSRPITTISYRAIPSEWTTANFRDGGVSSAACKTLMASLYGLVFDHSFLNSLKTIRLLHKNENSSIYEVFFARPYWSLTMEKQCFARLPSFVEREIDEAMGVVPAYEGDGIVTRLGLSSLCSGFKVLSAVKTHIRDMESKAEQRKASLLEAFAAVERIDLSASSTDELHALWVKFVKNDYYKSEYTYFSYVFCNMILSVLFKAKIKKHLPENEVINLMLGLSDVSHMRPIYDAWAMSRRGYSEDEFNAFIEKYKHHSQHELDISYPNWDEMPEQVRSMIKDLGRLGNEHDPRALGEKQTQKYLDTLARVPKKLHKDIKQLRRFLWWREEFKDISTRSYLLIRRLTLALGRAWEREGVLQSADDIFFLSVSDIEEKNTINVSRNKKYYMSFTRFNSPNELGSRHTTSKAQADGARLLKGIACSGEAVTATARVIKDIHDCGRLEQGDILVTQCTDPAWTAVFGRLGGVVTETGGLLSHAAVISREYGLPCILLAKNATAVIRDGDIITMDCKTGIIRGGLL